MTTETVLAWHFLHDDSTRAQDDARVEPGAVETCPDGALVVCGWGMHACERPLDALRYARGALIRRVELSGEVVRGEGEHADKIVGRVRRELWRADVTTLLHEFACWCAEQELERERAAGREPDPRSWAAIEVKRRWLRGEATDEELAAAWAAAWAAARDAAWAAAWDAQNAELERRLLALPEASEGRP